MGCCRMTFFLSQNYHGLLQGITTDVITFKELMQAKKNMVDLPLPWLCFIRINSQGTADSMA